MQRRRQVAGKLASSLAYTERGGGGEGPPSLLAELLMQELGRWWQFGRINVSVCRIKEGHLGRTLSCSLRSSRAGKTSEL